MYFRNLFLAWLAWWADIRSLELLRFLLGGDRFINALAGGYYKFTISGRVGFFSSIRFPKTYWLVLEWMIDQSFYPLEGPDHCERACRWERRTIEKKKKYRRGNDVALFLLSLFVFVGCLVIAPIAYFIAATNEDSHQNR